LIIEKPNADDDRTTTARREGPAKLTVSG